MIKLSTRGRYGTRLMLELALQQGNGPVQLKRIARNQEISERYLEHLIRLLKSAGMVKAVRGAHGGYSLARKPEKIALKDILEKLEGSLAPSACITAPSQCTRSGDCSTRDIWSELEKKISAMLESISLKDILEKERKKKKLLKPIFQL